MLCGQCVLVPACTRLMEAFLISTGIVALAEMGDKTQLLSLVLAARFRHDVHIAGPRMDQQCFRIVGAVGISKPQSLRRRGLAVLTARLGSRQHRAGDVVRAVGRAALAAERPRFDVEVLEIGERVIDRDVDRLADAGVDVRLHRGLDARPDQYTWWSNRGQAWAKNVGWRIDYQIATPGIAATARRASIYKAKRFSDHAPLIIDYEHEL